MTVESDRPVGIGWPESYGAAGIQDRVQKLGTLRPLCGHRLLDVGCGNGSYTIELAARFDEAVGVEIEPGRLNDFRQRLESLGCPPNLSVYEMSAEELVFPDEHFDVVTAIEVIEHIVDPERAAQEIYRVLRADGVFLITAPNRWFPIETHSFMIKGKERRSKRWPLVPWIKPLHRRIATARNYRLGDLERWLTPLGFVNIGIDYLMPPFGHARFGPYLRPISQALGRTPLKTFGVSIVAGYWKPPNVIENGTRLRSLH